MPYATKTYVPVERTRAEIERVVHKYGANKFAIATDNQSRIVMIEFAMRNRRFLAHVVMPDGRRFGEIVIPQLEGPGAHDNG